MKRVQSNEFAGVIAIAVGLASVLVIGGIVLLSIHLGNLIQGSPQQLPGNPFEIFAGIYQGDISWTWTMTLMVVVILVAILSIFISYKVHQRRRYGKRTRVDYAAKHMGRGSSIAALRKRSVSASAARLGVTSSIGLQIGETLRPHIPVYATWEDMWTIIAGPRTGKTTSLAVPSIAAAPGALIVTSNKPDIVQDTRAYRAQRGRCWVFNPQQVANDEPTWWWNPLSSVVDDVSAEKLARHFSSGSREPGAKTDAYFDNAGVNLLKALLLAAALGGKNITQVASWLYDASDREPLALLDRNGTDWPLIREALADTMALPEKQRAGVYGTAQQMAACLTNSHVVPWVCKKGDEDTRPEFNHRDFVTSSDTLYSLSREGAGTAGPLVLALTAAVIEEAERQASRRPTGRLETPLLAVLDEAANVCRWATLPDLYSHFGSRGIIIQTILQSWSQGVDVWTESGMKKLWSASNIKIYLGGVGETQFLQMLSESIGDREIRTASVSSGKGHSVSWQRSRDRILDISELQAFPRGRAIVLASGCRPALIRTIPWWQGPHANELKNPAVTQNIHERPQAVQAAESPMEVEGQGEGKPGLPASHSNGVPASHFAPASPGASGAQNTLNAHVAGYSSCLSYGAQGHANELPQSPDVHRRSVSAGDAVPSAPSWSRPARQNETEEN